MSERNQQPSTVVAMVAVTLSRSLKTTFLSVDYPLAEDGTRTINKCSPNYTVIKLVSGGWIMAALVWIGL